jgi:hypothetical protein
MTKTVAIAMIGPDSLKEGFTVLLRSARQIDSLIYASRREALREFAGVLIPDLIIIHVARSKEECKVGQVPIGDIAQILAEWPGAHSIALVDDSALQKQVEDLGIDRGLLEGVAPDRLLGAIDQLLASRRSGQNQAIAY